MNATLHLVGRLDVLAAIHVASNGDRTAQRLLLDIHRSLPTSELFLLFCQAAGALGITGPELVQIRAELGSNREVICHVLQSWCDIMDIKPNVQAYVVLLLAFIRERMTW